MPTRQNCANRRSAWSGERLLSATFYLWRKITAPRASSLLKLDRQGGIIFVDGRFGQMGTSLGESCWHLAGEADQRPLTAGFFPRAIFAQGQVQRALHQMGVVQADHFVE